MKKSNVFDNNLESNKDIKFSFFAGNIIIIIDAKQYKYKVPDLNDGFTKITEGNPCYCITNEKELIGILKWCNLGNNKYSYRIVGVFDKIVREFAELNHLGENIYDNNDGSRNYELEQNLYREIYYWRNNREINRIYRERRQKLVEKQNEKLRFQRIMEDDKMREEFLKKFKNSEINEDIFN